jgi:hypothetical protein
MRYKLKQTYFGSPQVGTIVERKETVRDNMPYYECNGRSYTTDEVENYSHLWEKLEDEYPTFEDADNIKLHHSLPVPYLNETHTLLKLLHLRDMWWAKDNWKPNWQDEVQDKYSIYLRSKSWAIGIFNTAPELFSFKDEATAEKFLEQNREYLEQLKTLYNGI